VEIEGAARAPRQKREFKSFAATAVVKPATLCV